MTQPTRTALITGAANGIGRATAEHLAANAYALFLVDQDEDALRATAARLEEAGADVAWRQADVASRPDVESTVAAAIKRLGRIDGLANIAGGAGPRHLHAIEDVEDADWEHVISLNLGSTFLMCRAVVAAMRTRGHGRIVNMASTLAHGRYGPVGTAGARLAYAAAKAGIVGFTRQLAKDVASDGITVNAVSPWLTLSEPGSRIRTRYESLDKDAQARVVAGAPMGRPAEAHEVAAAVGFLLATDSGYVSGVELPVDGAYLTT